MNNNARCKRTSLKKVLNQAVRMAKKIIYASREATV